VLHLAHKQPISKGLPRHSFSVSIAVQT